VLAVMVGIGILAIPESRRVRITAGLDLISEVLFSFVNLVMKLAPLGTFGAVAFAVGSNGTTVLIALAQLVLSFYAVVALFIVVVMGLIARLAGFSMWRFMRYIKDEILIVLGTASSESALPRLLIKLERLGCAKQTVGLVLPTGYAFNLDGTSIFMSMGVMFIAHAYNVPITFEHQLGILLLMLLTSKGAATVSGGSFVVFAATVTSTGILPVEGLAVIFGVYRFMSMAIAACNTIGNSLATVVVARWSGTFDSATAQRHLYPERYPLTARADAGLDDGNLLPRDQAGELVHRGPNVMMGYYKDPKATEEARKFGWHHTGDLALIDEHGEVLFLDRKKDMIKSGGENVASVKIEEALLAHPAVQNAAVVGLPHPQWGEAVSAFVKLKPGAQADEAGIAEHCRKHLGGFQIPKLVRILDEMPMTATGKLRKVELRQAFSGYFAEKSA